MTPGSVVPHRPSNEPERDRRARTLQVGSIGYTGTFHEQSVDITEVSVVSVLEARGPE